MRELSEALKAAQQAGALNPLYKIVLTKGENSYTYEKDRIRPSEHDEWDSITYQEFKHLAELADKQYEG